jgi:drug/metabolite transporter (DMT)-like permease
MRPSAAVKAFLAVTFWGASFVATKIVLRDVSPLTVIILRFGLGVIVLACIVAARRQFALPRTGDLGWLIFLGLNGTTVHQLLQANGLVTTSATNSGWMVALTPVFSALLAWVIMREPFGRSKVLGLVLATCGAFLVISRGQLSRGLLNIPATPGDFLMLLSSPNWALFTVLSKRFVGTTRRVGSPALMLTYAMAFGWLAILPLFLGARGWLDFPRLTLAGWGGLLFLGVLCSGVAYTFWYDALEVAGASQVAAFLYLEPIVTVIVASTLIGEKATWATLVGGAIILVGVWLVNRAVTGSEERGVMRMESQA